MNPGPRPEHRLLRGGFSVSAKIFLSFGSLCAILVAIGGHNFFSLRGIEQLSEAERQSTRQHIEAPDRLIRNAGLRQTEIFQCVAAKNPVEREEHEQVVARLAKSDAEVLRIYAGMAANDAERRLLAEVQRTSHAYSEKSDQLLALNRSARTAEAAVFALTVQLVTYDRYQTALDAVLRNEVADGYDIARVTSERIARSRIAGEILIAVGVVIVLGTAVAVLRMIRRLRQDKLGLEKEVDDHKESQRALREGEARYRLLVDHSPDGILVICENQIVFANPAIVRLLGADEPGQLLGLNPSAVVHPDEHSEISARASEVAAGQQPPVVERRMLRLDGSILEVEASIISFIYEGKRAEQVILRDNSERRAAQKRLQEAEEKYRAIFDNASEGIFQSTPDGTLLAANLALAQMLGFETAAQLIEGYREVEQAYADPARRKEFQHLLEKEGVANQFEYELKRKDGSRILISENARIVRDSAGQPIYYEGSMQDITERKRSEEDLLRSLERFRCFTLATSQIIWQTDPAGNVLEELPTWCAYTGQTLQASLGRGWTDCIHPDDRAATERRWTACMESKSLFEVEYRLRGSDEIYRLFLVRGVPVLDPQGEIREWVGTSTDITARKQAEQVLAESERRFRFLNNLGDATRTLTEPHEIMATVTRLLGAHLRVTRCAYAEVGPDGDQFTVPGDYTRGCESMAGREYRFSDFGSPTHAKMMAGRTSVLRDVAAELIADDGVMAFDAIEAKAMIACPLIKNGRLLAVMAVYHSAPRQWTEGDISLVEEVVERSWSIIERARAELVLRASEEHLSLIIAASNDGIFEHDFVTDIVTWSDRMYEMLGLERNSFTPSIRAFSDLLHPDDRPAFQASVSGQIAHGGRYDAHTRIRRHDGTYGNFLGRGRVLRDAAGQPARIVGSMSDLTSLLQAEQKMVEQAKLLNLAQDAIMVRDMEDRIEFWNHGAEALYGWTAAEVLGRSVSEVLHPAESDSAPAESTLLETGAWSGEGRHLTKQGAAVIVRSRWTLVRDEQGKPKSKLVINTDITEQKKIEEQFLRAQRLESIGTLASGVAHDLNNILLPIMMAAPILREELDPVERDKFLDIVESSARRGAEIIKQVLTFARGADGDHILLQPIYLLEEVANIASQTFPKTITLRTSYDEDIRSLEAEPTQLHQVLLNLCINARDAMPHGGQLCLGAENFDVDEHYASVTPGATAGPHVVLQVTDTGSGIPSDVADKIFDPFFTTKGVGEGTGLGLSTVAGIVKGHGGFLKLYSEPGHTSFKVFLPAKEPVDGAGLAAVELPVPGGDGQTILVVDDEPAIREVAQLILESHGYKVLVAEDGPEALALFEQETGQIAAVVTDLAMPLMHGLALVRALHRIEPDLKIIISTGRNDDSQSDEMTALKVAGCLLKPFTTRELLLKLDQVLHRDLRDAA